MFGLFGSSSPFDVDVGKFSYASEGSKYFN